MNSSAIPSYIKQYFWGDDLDDLDLSKNKEYILQTILERGNAKALSWLFSLFSKGDIKNMLSKIKLSKKSAHFWSIYFS